MAPSEWVIVTRVLVAFIVGVVVGFDRERSGKAAGIRTQMLVCVSSALMSAISIQLAEQYNIAHVGDQGLFHADPERLMAQIISGIGFLGAGVIIKNGSKVVGLTTAATIWTTAAIGIGIGSGFYLPAILTTILTLLLNPIAYFQYKYGLKGDFYSLRVNVFDEDRTDEVLKKMGVMEKQKEIREEMVTFTILSSYQRNQKLLEMLKNRKIGFEIEMHED